MNCQNCAAPLTMSVGPARMLCSFCQTVHAAPGIEIDLDRVHVTSEPQGVNCPACSTELVSGHVDEAPVCVCPECRGLLLEGAIFRQVVEQRRASYLGVEVPAPQPHAAEFERRLTCPGCQSLMEVHPYYGAGRAVIDSCAVCRLVWIDHGELAGLERSPGRRTDSAIMETIDADSVPSRKVSGVGQLLSIAAQMFLT